MTTLLKKIHIVSISLILLSAGLLILDFDQANASPGSGCQQHNVWGWAWSDGIGWVSFSCENQYEIGSGINYGVDIDESTGEISGHAWSDRVGWISFNSVDLQGCPEGSCQAVLEGSELSGWAKALINDEWIALSGDITGGGSYGVELIDSKFYGWARGDKIVGWLSFNCEDEGICSQSPYAVETSLALPPEALNAESVVRYCNHHLFPQVATGVTVTFSWDYHSEEGNPQDGYEIHVSEYSHFPSDDRFEKVADISSLSCILNLADDPFWKDELDWNTAYYWRVRVSDGERWSEWLTSQFTIERTHPSPYVIFSYSPESNISSGEVVEFIPEKWDDEFGEMKVSQVYDGSTPLYNWTFEGGDPEMVSTSTATTTFEDVGTWAATLRVTDSAGYYCERTENMDIKVPLPDWKEITPFGKSRLFMAGITEKVRTFTTNIIDYFI